MTNKPEIHWSLDQWLDYLTKLHHKEIDLGLERVRQVAKNLGLIPYKQTVITVAGTNGKGSNVALLEAILMAAGYQVGALTSPHLISYNERIRVQAKQVSDAEIIKAFSQIEQARQNISLSYFEFNVLAALIIFAASPLDIVILEVGLGGRLDAVNIIDADVAIIASVDLDHQDYLGDTREAIALEKIGIARTGKPLVCGDTARPKSIDAYCQQQQIPLYAINENYHFSTHGKTWSWHNNTFHYENLPKPRLLLENAATAIQAIHCLPKQFNVNEAAIRRGLLHAFVPGRQQVVDKFDIPVILDVAHNPHAASRLAEFIRARNCSGHCRAVLTMLQQKDVINTIKPLMSHIDFWYLANSNRPKGYTAKQLSAILQQLNIENINQFTDTVAALEQALLDADTNDEIIVFGSFYSVAPVMQMCL